MRCSCTATVSETSFTQVLHLPHCLKFDSNTCLAAKPVLQQAQGGAGSGTALQLP